MVRIFNREIHNFCSFFYYLLYCGFQVKENEMGVRYCTHGRGNICAQDLACKQRKNVEANLKSILKFIPKK
jgi:hypothetical protein